MTRFTAPSDSYAAALARVWAAGSGFVLLPAVELPKPYQSGGFTTVYAATVDAFCPLPAVGKSFFVGEAWAPKPGGLRGSADKTVSNAYYRANGRPPYGSLSVDRWRPARQMREEFARSRFEVVSRRALHEMEITEDIVAKCGIPTANFEGRISYLGRSDRGLTAGSMPTRPLSPGGRRGSASRVRAGSG